MGKWDKTIQDLKLERENRIEPSKLDRYIALREEVLKELNHDLSGTALLAMYEATRNDRDLLNVQVKRLNLRVMILEQLMDDSQERGASGWGEYGTTEGTVKLASGTKATISHEPLAQVKDRDAVRAWAVASGFERSLNLAHGTLNSEVKKLLARGLPAPDGVSLWVRTKVSLSRAKGSRPVLEDIDDFDLDLEDDD